MYIYQLILLMSNNNIIIILQFCIFFLYYPNQAQEYLFRESILANSMDRIEVSVSDGGIKSCKVRITSNIRILLFFFFFSHPKINLLVFSNKIYDYFNPLDWNCDYEVF